MDGRSCRRLVVMAENGGGLELPLMNESKQLLWIILCKT